LFGLDKDKKDDSKPDEEKPSSDKKKPKEKPNFNFNFNAIDPKEPFQRNIILALLGLGGAGLFYLIYDTTKTITYTVLHHHKHYYQEFVRNYLDKDLVRKVVIEKSESNNKVIAHIYLDAS
jgi:hypothetical protein